MYRTNSVVPSITPYWVVKSWSLRRPENGRASHHGRGRRDFIPPHRIAHLAEGASESKAARYHPRSSAALYGGIFGESKDVADDGAGAVVGKALAASVSE